MSVYRGMQKKFERTDSKSYKCSVGGIITDDFSPFYCFVLKFL